MKHIAELPLGGFITDNYHHEFIESMIKERDAAILAVAGNKAIISGVVVSGVPAAATTGIVVYNGKLYTFLPGEVQTEVTTKRIAIDRPNASGIDAAAYYQDVIEFGNDGLETFPFAELKRVKTLQEIILDDSLVNVVPEWDSITGKPAFLTRKMLGTIILGDVPDASVSHSGDISTSSIIETDGNDQHLRITFPTVGTSSYIPNVAIDSKSADFNKDNDVIWSIKSRTATTLDILLRDVSGAVQNINIIVQIIV